MNIVLLEPEIPQNTGNIGRTCCATGTKLHLIEPMGFKINEKSVKRAGMDYWEHLDVTIYESYEDFLKKIQMRKYGWQQLRDQTDIVMLNLKKMITSCLEKKVQGYLRKY